MAIVRYLLPVLFSISVFIGAGELRAQESESVSAPTAPVVPPATGNAGPDLQARGADLLLRTESGDLIPLRELLPDDLIDEILLRGMEQRSVPRYTVAQQELVRID